VFVAATMEDVMTQAPTRDGMTELSHRRSVAAGLGGPERVQRQHERGLMTALERAEMLLDPGTRIPFGPLVHSGVPGEEDRTMGDGMLIGFGQIDGRWVGYEASDATIKGASGGAGSARRRRAFHRVMEEAGLPMFGLMQGGGARITDIVTSRFAGFHGPSVGDRLAFPRRGAHLIAVLGNYYGPGPTIDGDYRVMTAPSNFSVSSPPIVEEATGEKVSAFDLGGAAVHSKITGEIDAVVPDDEAAIAQLRRVFSYFPANAWEEPPVVRTGDPWDRTEEALRDLIPARASRVYDVKKAIKAVVDRDSYIEWMPDFAKQLTCGIARLDGHSVGIIANQPGVRAGSLDVDSGTKVRRILQICEFMRLPLVSFIDVPGVLPTVEEEHRRLQDAVWGLGIDRVRLPQPKLSVILRKAYGFAIFAMSGADPEWYSYAWPSAQIAFVGPEPGVRVSYRKQWQAAEDKDAFVAKYAEQIRLDSEPWNGAKLDFLDDVIDPAATRPILIKALAVARERTRNSETQRGWERPRA
jgi:acetyl-CoA carboxylase carboxyltransferase component